MLCVPSHACTWLFGKACDAESYPSQYKKLPLQFADLLTQLLVCASVQGVYKEELQQHFGIVFNSLFCLNNMPIKRYVDYLQRRNKLEEYMQVNMPPHLHAHDFILRVQCWSVL